MDFKQKVNEEIAKEMPFLNKIDIKFSDSKVDDFISKKLLPYLFFTNTVDAKHRLIPIFLSNTQNVIQLPLFYGLALYKTYSEAYLTIKNFENIHLPNQNINIRHFDGTICNLIGINFSSNDVIIRNGRGEKKFIDFKEAIILENNNKRLGYYKSLEQYFNKISSFKNDIAIKDNPLELISKMQNALFNASTCNGALYFTKYQNSLKKIIVNDQKFFNVIPASRIEYIQGEVEKEKLGHETTKQGKAINKIKEFLIFTHPDNYNAFDTIKKDANWLNTIIFDFTQNTKDLPNVLKLIQKEYTNKLETGEIKDIYLLFNEKDICNYLKVSEKLRINHTPYLLNLKQKRYFSNNTNVRVPNIVNIGKDDIINNFSDAFNVLWKLCKHLHIINLKEKIIDPLFEIRNRYFSFYDPDDLNKKVEDFSTEITKTQSNFFYNNEWNKDFDVIMNLVKNLKHRLVNSKINAIKKIEFNSDSNVCIISCNNNVTDHNFIKKGLNINNIIFQNLWEIKEPIDILNSFDAVLIFNSTKELNTVLNLNNFNNLIHLFFNEQELSYYNWINEVQIPKLSSDTKLTQILNLNLVDCEQEETKDVELYDNDNLSAFAEFNLVSFINGILKENKTNRIYAEYVRNKELGQIMLFFNDSTSNSVNENRYFFTHKENIKKLKDCHIQAKDLNIGDIVFINMHDAEEFEKLIWNVAKDFPDIEKELRIDKYWRNQIRKYLEIKNFNTQDFRNLLDSNGYEIQSSLAIQNWIDGDVYEPRNLENLITVLFNRHILTDYNVEIVCNSIKIVKKLKTSLPRELRKIHVAKLNDLEYDSDFEFPQIGEKMLQFLDIKTISLII